MADMLRLCMALEYLTAALETALLSDDFATFAAVTQGRAPIVAQCLDVWASLSQEEQATIAPRWEAVLARDAVLLQTGKAWLSASRTRLARLQQGMKTLKGYRAPLDVLASLRQGTSHTKAG